MQEKLLNNRREKTVIFFTVNVPYGKGEEFILQEILALEALGLNVLVCPRKSPTAIFHPKAAELLNHTVALPLMNFKVLRLFLGFCFVFPARAARLFSDITFKAESFASAAKNFLVFPKAVAISCLLKGREISHAHACWGTTPATMAYVFAAINKIPWSTTLHRHDIYENNMLSQKLKSVVFARCISQKGKSDALSITNLDLNGKVKIVHMGVQMNTSGSWKPEKKVENARHVYHFAVPAMLLPVKGHRYLIKACAILRDRGITNFTITCYGDGPLRQTLLAEIEAFNVGDLITLHKTLPHEQLLQLYQNHQVDCVLVPSIVTPDGQFEGIPVSLMEAMAYGLPVISTRTGSIPELLGDGAGILTHEKDPLDLADAMAQIINDLKFQRDDPAKRIQKIYSEFNSANTSRQMYDLLVENSA